MVGIHIAGRYVANALDIDVEKETEEYQSRGVGGSAKIYFLKKKLKVKIGDFETRIPVGFSTSNDLPPLLGRHKCLNLFDLRFYKFQTTFRA